MKLSRREFGQWLGTGVSLAPFARSIPQANAAETGRKIGYCIVGLGRISLQHFMPACKLASHSKVVALVSGHREKAEKVAPEYGVSPNHIYSYENFDEIAGNKEVDAVYIALPNSMHAEYTIRAAKAGKHVLCEKPMATSVKDCEAMIETCMANYVKLFIAYRCQYEPTNLKAVELIHSGKVGQIQTIESANGFNITPGEWRLDKKLAGGGPLMDVGIYSLNACRYLTAEEPSHLDGYASVIDRDGRFKTVEENVTWAMRFPSGVTAACTTTYGANMSGSYTVYCSKGTIHLEPAFAYQGIHMKVQIHGEPPIEVTEEAKDPSQFATEADEFSHCILNNVQSKTDGAEGLRDMKYMQRIYKSAGIEMA